MDIKIEEPIDLYISIIQFEEKNIPSIYVNILLNSKFFDKTEFKVSMFTWIECRQWSIFVKNLHDGSFGKEFNAELKNMDDKSIIKIFSSDEEKSKFIQINIEKESNKYRKSILLSESSNLDDDKFKSICDKFINFPIWW